MALSALFSPAAAQAPDAVIEAVRYGVNAGKTRVVIDLDRSVEFRAFVLDDPWRVVVDMPRSDWRIPKSRYNGGGIVKSYRSGELEDGLTRVVFDLERPGIIAAAFTLPKDSMARNRIVIDLQPASQNLFSARAGKMYGVLRPDDVTAKPAAQAPSALAASRNRTVAAAAPPEEKSAQLPARKPAPAASPRGKAGRKYTIVIDPGHGGSDPGAVGTGGIFEKNITLSAARVLRQQLEETGRYRVVMTRDKDVSLRLRERVNIARQHNADLFISVHADKIARTDVRGASIYTLSMTASDAETARLADQENTAGIVAGVDLAGESQDVANILLDLAMREKMNESNLLARYMQSSMRSKSVRLLPNSHRSAGFAVLKAPDVPSVLIEIGFLSNPQEAKLLSSAEFQRRISSAIVEGIDTYFRKIESLQKI